MPGMQLLHSKYDTFMIKKHNNHFYYLNMAPNLRFIEHLFSSSSKAPRFKKKKKGGKLHNGL